MIVINWRARWSCCLGPVILLNPGADNVTKRHEFGHYLQWRHYHLFYWVIVAIPSAARWLWDVTAHRHWGYQRRRAWYYSGWPEHNADKRGCVDSTTGRLLTITISAKYLKAYNKLQIKG